VSVANRNELVREVQWVSGVKTGQTTEAGYVLVASGERKGVELVSAVLGAPSEAERDAATLELLRYGASLYERREAVGRGEQVTRVPVAGEEEPLPLEAARAVAVIARSDQEVDVVANAPAEVDGPVERGERIARAAVLVDGDRVAGVPLLAARAVAEPGLLERLDGELPGGERAVWALGALALAVLAAALLLALARRRAAR
jgi:serine-type D-Ala-D-Ala carboxypeptidase (penicillin-binding protein 5/6)